MNHLTTDEIIHFVSFGTLERDNLELAAKVNAHLLRCAECFEKVRRCQAKFDAAQYSSGSAGASARDTESQTEELSR